MVATPILVSATPAFADCSSNVTGVTDEYTIPFGTTLSVGAPGLLANDEAASGITTLHINIDDSDTQSFANDGSQDNITYLPGGSSGSGAFKYTPPFGFAGEDSFEYEVSDPNNCNDDSPDTDFGEVDITVLASIKNDAYSTKQNTALHVAAPGVFANDLGFDADSGIIGEGVIDNLGNVVKPGLSAHNGSVDVEDDGSLNYVPPTGFSGVDTFQYQVLDVDDDNVYTATVSVNVSAAATPPSGYWMVTSNGTVFPFGHVKNFGNAPTSFVTHFEPTPSHNGYWVVNSAGQVFAFGDAVNLGSLRANLKPGEFVSSLSATPTGKGYWLFTSRGRAFTFGDAKFLGDMSAVALNGPVVGSIATASGKGYYMVGSDGGIFAFGDAKFFGSTGGMHLNKPVEGLVPTLSGKGYWMVASDGGIFAFGDAPFRGSMGSTKLNRPVVGMVRYGNGYLMVGSDGGIFDFSNLPFLGSLGANPPASPVVSVAA